MADLKVCSVVGCGKLSFGRGYCSMHYYRWLRYGDTAACFRKVAPKGVQTMVSLKCTQCQISFLRKPKCERLRIRKGQLGPFCSQSCRTTFMNHTHRIHPRAPIRVKVLPLSRSCVNCGNEFQPLKQGHTYCSRACQVQSMVARSSKVTDDERAQIAISTASVGRIAEQYGISKDRVWQIRKAYRDGTSHLSDLDLALAEALR